MDDKDEGKQGKDTPRSGGGEAAKLREEIDRGGSDKVAFMDPAASPLGTDDEAGGHPPTQEQAKSARAQEIRQSETVETKPKPRDLHGGKRRMGGAAVAVGLGACVLLLVFLFF